MKKVFAIALLSFSFLFIFSGDANAASCTVKANTCDESCVGGTVQANGDRTGGTRSGLVPCGINHRDWEYRIRRNASAPAPAGDTGGLGGEVIATSQTDALSQVNTIGTNFYGAGNYTVLSLVPRGGTLACRCELYHVFTLALTLYTFIIWDIALPIAGILIVFGGVLLLVSGINPKWHDLGNQMLWGAAIGLGFIFGSWLIVNIVLRAIGYQGNWFTF